MKDPGLAARITEAVVKAVEIPVTVKFRSGWDENNINAVEFAHMQGAHIVALTDSALSPIATHADSTLYAKSDMASFVDSLVAPLSIINALIVDIARKKKVELQNVFSRLETIWDEYDVYDKDSHI